jgi:putative transposase
MKFGFIAKHRGIWPVAWLCEALGVSRSGFHAWLGRARSARSRSDEELGARVRISFLASDRTYGARRVWHDLLADGVACGLHRIERLMRLQALRARPRRRRLPSDAGERQAGGVAANLLDRSFEAGAPNRKGIADFTYIWTAEGWLYLAAVIDLFSRRVVSWSMQSSMTAQLVADALMMAIWRRGKPRMLLHHSDQGSQYTSEQFQRLLADHGIICSMSRSGDVWGNSAMESFFSSLKIERIDRKTYRSRDEARADVFDYIERFYNPRRRHSTIGYKSPMEFERIAATT